MSVNEVMQLLPMVEGAVPAMRGPAIARLHELRRANPGVVRAAARQMGATQVAHGLVPPGGWANWLGELPSTPLRIIQPATQAELIGAFQQALDDGLVVKPIASGHATSAVGQPVTGGVAFDLSRLNKVLKRKWEKDVLPAYATGPGTDLVRIQAGATVRSASMLLHDLGFAFANTGTFDGQQLAGALCTGTHGSGATFTPLADMVVSLEMLTVVLVAGKPKVRLLRIEPTDGITDPTKFSRPLVQDDATFRSAVIAIGALGIVTNLTIKVVQKFWMTETREPSTWSKIRKNLKKIATSAEHVDIHINPYQDKGDHNAVIIRRTRIPWQDDTPPNRPDDQEFVKVIAKTFGTDLLGWFATNFPGIVADGIDRYCKKAGSFTSASYKVLITGYGYDIEATSAEFAVALADGVGMVDCVLGIAVNARNAPPDQRFRHSSPLGLRFVAKSAQHLSMHRDPVSATLEIPFVLGSKNIDLALRTYEAALPNARPHWGQVTSIDGLKAARLYGDDWTAWKAVYDQMNAQGVFCNAFTNQLDLGPTPAGG